jgi:hypothetical protein
MVNETIDGVWLYMYIGLLVLCLEIKAFIMQYLACFRLKKTKSADKTNVEMRLGIAFA